MRKLRVFNQVSLDGFFSDEHGDMSWAHKTDPEWTAWVSENAAGGGALVLGRVTYELMAGFWPTPAALQQAPIVAERMNAMPKIVFSKRLTTASWSNTQLVQGDPVAAIRRIQSEPGPDLVILGSGTIVSQLTDARLIDEYQIVVSPIVLGRGKTLFEGVRSRVNLSLQRSRTFGNGSVVLWYTPAA